MKLNVEINAIFFFYAVSNALYDVFMSMDFMFDMYVWSLKFEFHSLPLDIDIKS